MVIIKKTFNPFMWTYHYAIFTMSCCMLPLSSNTKRIFTIMAHVNIHPVSCISKKIILKPPYTCPCIHKGTWMRIVIFIITPYKSSVTTTLFSITRIPWIAPVHHAKTSCMFIGLANKRHFHTIILFIRKYIHHNTGFLKHCRRYVWSVRHLIYKTSVI